MGETVTFGGKEGIESGLAGEVGLLMKLLESGSGRLLVGGRIGGGFGFLLWRHRVRYISLPGKCLSVPAEFAGAYLQSRRKVPTVIPLLLTLPLVTLHAFGAFTPHTHTGQRSSR